MFSLIFATVALAVSIAVLVSVFRSPEAFKYREWVRGMRERGYRVGPITGKVGWWV